MFGGWGWFVGWAAGGGADPRALQGEKSGGGAARGAEAPLLSTLTASGVGTDKLRIEAPTVFLRHGRVVCTTTPSPSPCTPRPRGLPQAWATGARCPSTWAARRPGSASSTTSRSTSMWTRSRCRRPRPTWPRWGGRGAMGWMGAKGGVGVGSARGGGRGGLARAAARCRAAHARARSVSTMRAQSRGQLLRVQHGWLCAKCANCRCCWCAWVPSLPRFIPASLDPGFGCGR